MIALTPEHLVLTIYPNARGFGYVLFEGPLSPFDWGVKELRGTGKNGRIIRWLENVLESYAPSVLVLEDWKEESCGRIQRVDELYEQITAVAKKRATKVVRYSMTKVRQYFANADAFTKHDIAVAIAKIVPALSYQIPPVRKIWMAADARQGLYDAAALGLAYFGTDHAK
jgi:hypothetical protein